MAKPTRLEIRVGGRVVYSQDVFDYKLRMDNAELTLTASHAALPSLPPMPDNPLLPPAPTPDAPDGDDEPTPPVEPLIEQVHTGDRASRKQRRAAAAEVTSEVTVHPPGTVVDGVVDDVPETGSDEPMHVLDDSCPCNPETTNDDGQLVRHHGDLPEQPSGE